MVDVEVRKIYDVTHLTADDFSLWHDSLFSYQKVLHANIKQRIRNILHAPVIGLSEYFVGEAFKKATLTGVNQTFIACSPDMVDSIRGMFIRFASRFLNIELTGNGFTLLTKFGETYIRIIDPQHHFSSCFNGDVYLDEYFYHQNFNRSQNMASGISCLKKFTMTYYSRISDDRDAANFWHATKWMNRNPKSLVCNPSYNTMKKSGALCPDGQWRYIITIEEVVAGGCNWHDIDCLKESYTPEFFNHLYMCQFNCET